MGLEDALSSGIGSGSAVPHQAFYARTSEHGFETCVEHLCMTGCLSGGFAQQFGHGKDGLLAGLFHDIGKYSQAFQKRIRNPERYGKVDHSTAGALFLVQHGCSAASFAAIGHHTGLPDMGGLGELEGSTYSARMNRACSAGNKNPLVLADAWKSQLHVPASAFMENTEAGREIGRENKNRSFYSEMMLTRMLLSTLVDGDRLDAEFFTSNREDRAEHELLARLKERLGGERLAEEQAPSWNTLREAALSAADSFANESDARIAQLAGIVEAIARKYFDKPDKTPLDEKRCELLERCLDRGRDESCGPGLYTLTAPTGSGKTFSSIAFALEHARTHGLQRVIYVIPYTSIIDQTVGQFERIFGIDAVLPHYAEAPYQLKDESDMDENDLKRVLAAENWNAPIVVTTAVQFFESLYSNKTSRCRKLHNIANSVIVFDEAQTLPVPYLRPCVRVIAELVERYGATAVLCTATQPELKPLFDRAFDGAEARIPEISPFSDADRDTFRRVTVDCIGDIGLDALADRLGEHRQVLCVVNTRKKAQYLYGRLAGDDSAGDGEENSAEGVFCLTTLQCAADRRLLLEEIRVRLAADEPCRVVSTSLIEAGVDVDFPVAYREESGLDSIIQTAGRCNREGRRSAEESMVYVFSTEGGCAPFLKQNIEAFRRVSERCADADVMADTAIRGYFSEMLDMLGDASLDKRHILRLHENDANLPFERIAERFKLIDTPTVPVYIPLSGEGEALCDRLERNDIDRTLFRRLGKYAVNVWPKHLQQLLSAGSVEPVGRGASPEEDCFILRDMGLYSSRLGLSVDVAAADGIFI
ncbi:CRISPR-associated helicase Cas3' [Bifidobacterium callitrichos]|nr:CRISPR-associated helicase Cas3' [Bifidobacterium callitrichos]